MSGKTKIRTLGKSVAAAAELSQHEYQADTGISDKQLEDARVLDRLTMDIQGLDKESHKQIYLLVRKYKPSKFFTQESKTLIFDRDSLSDKAIMELYNLVELCKENQERSKVIKEAERVYLGDRPKETEDDNGIPPSLEAYDPDFSNPSEKQKLKNMLSLNNLSYKQ